MIRSPIPRRALTLIEMVVALVIVSVILLSSLNTIGVARVGLRSLHDANDGRHLAQDLLAEMMRQEYVEPANLATLRKDILVDGGRVVVTMGPESPEDTTGDRSLFDDIDDYHGWVASPPQRQDGSKMTHLVGWERSVKVSLVQADDVQTTTTEDEGVKVILVSVKHNGATVATATALRTIGIAPHEACCLPDGSCADLVTTICTSNGGTAQGEGTTCDTTSCGATGPTGPVLLAHWTFDEGTGFIANDSAGANHAKVDGGAWVSGQLGGAVKFDSTNDYAVVGDRDALSLAGTDFTITAWGYKPANGTNYDTIINKNTTTPSAWWLGTYGREVAFGFYTAASGWDFTYTAGINLARRRWYHYAVTFDDVSGEVKIYVDGANVHTATMTSRPDVLPEAVMFGRSPLPNESWPGTIDDVRIYGDVLTPTEIGTVLSGGAP